MKPWFWAALLALLPIPAIAGMACVFATECYEGEACIDSGFSLAVETALAPGSLAAEGGFPEGDTIVTDAETIPVTWAGSGAALGAFGSTKAGFFMLSIAPDGAARYTAHLPAAEFGLTYVGRCEGT